MAIPEADLNGRRGAQGRASKQPVGKSAFAARPAAATAPVAEAATHAKHGSHRDRRSSPEAHPWATPDRFSHDSIDRAFKANLARMTFGISPAGIASKYIEWFMHLAVSPGKQLQQIEKAQNKAARLLIYAAAQSADSRAPRAVEPLPQDHRFEHESWRQYPFNIAEQAFLLTQQWWHGASTNVDGVSQRDEEAIAFVTRQILDLFSPSNSMFTNPEVMQATVREGGANLVRGWRNLIEDLERQVSGTAPSGAEKFVVGKNMGITPGKVVYRNHLIELIQYEPTGEQVHAEPMLIVPAWIMKFYILDLSPEKSMVQYLVDCGFTVFIISWRNPTAEDRDLGMADYLELGVESAMKAVRTIVPGQKIHATGYCIGGTLLAIAAAAMHRDREDWLQSLTLLTTQTDFTEAGELLLLVRESGLSYLENMMWDKGYLDTKQMAGAFQMLRSNDMIGSRSVREYMLGERSKIFDLLAWNADPTRMPYRMQSEYLRKLYQANELAQGQYDVRGRPVSLKDIDVPIFAVATTSDHIAPWRSVYKLHLLTDADLTFVLTNGGHNAGIVSEIGKKGRKYQIATRRDGDAFIGPDEWVQQATQEDRSWWLAWTAWLEASSSGLTAPPQMGRASKGLSPLADAPGAYVHQR